MMVLVVDTNIVIGQLAHRGSKARRMLHHPGLELLMAREIWIECDEKLALFHRQRIERGRLDPDEEARDETVTRDLLNYYVRLVAENLYSDTEEMARLRMERDLDDWPTLATALSVNAGIWTTDRNHFWGCGVATWRTDVIIQAIGFGDSQ